MLAADLRAAAAGTPTGPLTVHLGSVEPRRPADPPGAASPDAITLRYTPHGGAVSRLVQPLAPGASTAVIDAVQACPAGTTACGFVTGSLAVVFDGAGHAAFVLVQAIGPGLLTIIDVNGPRATGYAVGAEIAEAVQVTYVHDHVARQLRRQEAGGSFVAADNVSAVTYEYFDAAMAAMPLASLHDGPYLGSGATRFDADVLRIRTVRATLRLETGLDAMRGTDARLFARPGTATGRRVIHDIVLRMDVSLRNIGS
jgi:hypothetical protein